MSLKLLFKIRFQLLYHGYRIFARMNLADVAKVRELLSQSSNIIIVPHKNPDGDAIGSILGLFHFLKVLGKTAQVIVPNDYPKFLKWMPGNNTIVNFERQYDHAEELAKKADLIFTLDFNHFSRTGQMEKVLESSEAIFIMIDHHQQPSDYATVTYSDVSMSSTCEMVYNFIEALGKAKSITPEIATCLYTGIMTDTGSFKFSSTTSRTHRVVAELIDKGAQNMQIHQQVFDTNSPARLHLLGAALNNLVILPEYRTAFITLSQKELDQHNFSKGDTEGFVNYGLTLENIVFAVIFIENQEEGIIKISFRSVGGFSVNEFARSHFNGGGHTNAAGGRSTVSIDKTVERFKMLLKRLSKPTTGMKKLLFSYLLLVLFAACGEPEPRKPVQVKSGSFFKESVERSRRILEMETQVIQKLIAKDSLKEYFPSTNGFWYTYETKKDSTGYLPKTNDVLLLTYNIMSLNGDTIYKADNIGLAEHAVDKSQLFPGLRNAVKLLQKDEKATFIFPSGQAFGYKGDNDRIGPNIPIKSSVNILEIKKDSSNIKS